MRSARMITRHALPALLPVLTALALPPAPATPWELGVEGQAGYFSMAATRSAEAVFDSSGGFTWGGGLRYSLDMGVYLAGSMRVFSKDGERVYVAGPADPVAGLGHPLSVKISPINLTVGYRFRQGELIVPYGGVGAAITAYTEESSVAGIRYDQSFTRTGFLVVGGVEVGRGMFRFGAEAGWSTVPDAVGFGGVTEIYGEDDIGGWSVVGKVVIAFGGGKGTPMPESIK